MACCLGLKSKNAGIVPAGKRKFRRLTACFLKKQEKKQIFLLKKRKIYYIIEISDFYSIRRRF